MAPLNMFLFFKSVYHLSITFNLGNIDPKPTNLSGADGAGRSLSDCGASGAGDDCTTTGLPGSSADNKNNHHSNFSPQGNMKNSSSTMNNGGKDNSNSDVQKLQEQLNDIKEQVSLPSFAYSGYINFFMLY